ncbi:TetR family transcriptional regulator [Embleya sp. NBC_00888]|uniref:TetR/AcrR family transcriptional regulator n=1 Tax=Embleya sp. NBC_00888 TaxID=2975960 RepID=UPI00387057FD|nr:TetR family transcriptional regulator [Embleya sp. NBC_00888]
MVERDGAAGVSHRTVSREAGLPTSASTYYFDGVDDLLTAALTSCMTADAIHVRSIAAAPGDTRRALAEHLNHICTSPGLLVAEYELFLLAARRPELRESTDHWMAAVTDFALRFTTDAVRVRVFVGALDGLLIQALLTDAPPSTDEWEAMIRDLLPGPCLAPPTPSGSSAPSAPSTPSAPEHTG